MMATTRPMPSISLWRIRQCRPRPDLLVSGRGRGSPAPRRAPAAPRGPARPPRPCSASGLYQRGGRCGEQFHRPFTHRRGKKRGDVGSPKRRRGVGRNPCNGLSGSQTSGSAAAEDQRAEEQGRRVVQPVGDDSPEAAAQLAGEAEPERQGHQGGDGGRPLRVDHGEQETHDRRRAAKNSGPPPGRRSARGDGGRGRRGTSSLDGPGATTDARTNSCARTRRSPSTEI